MSPAALATQSASTPGAIESLHRLLVTVMGTSAPGPAVLVALRSYDRALVRHWGERQLARQVCGGDGCPPLAVPPALERYVARQPHITEI